MVIRVAENPYSWPCSEHHALLPVPRSCHTTVLLPLRASQPLSFRFYSRVNVLLLIMPSMPDTIAPPLRVHLVLDRKTTDKVNQLRHLLSISYDEKNTKPSTNLSCLLQIPAENTEVVQGTLKKISEQTDFVRMGYGRPILLNPLLEGMGLALQIPENEAATKLRNQIIEALGNESVRIHGNSIPPHEHTWKVYIFRGLTQAQAKDMEERISHAYPLGFNLGFATRLRLSQMTDNKYKGLGDFSFQKWTT